MSKKTIDRSLLLRIVREDFPRYKWRYAKAFFFMAITAICVAMTARIMKDLTNGIFGERSMTMAYYIGGAILVIFLAKGFSSYITSVILAKIGNEIVAEKQKLMFSAMMKQGVAYHAKQTTGDLITRITHNAASVRDVLQVLVTSTGRDLLSVIGLLVVMISQEPLLFAICGLIMPLAILGVNKLRARVKTIANAEFQSISEIIETMKESTQGIRIIKSFNLESDREVKMGLAIEAVQSRSNKIATLLARTTPMMETLGGFAIAGVIVYGGFRVIHQGSDPGSFFSFLTALLLAYDPAKRLARTQVYIEHGLVGAKRMFEIIDAPLEITEGNQELIISKGEITFQNVSFTYDEKQVIEGLNFTAEGGKTIAIVGSSGAGKSTIISLIHRFYDVTGGRISIDGQDIRDVTHLSLKNALCYIGQDIFLFKDTIKNNILGGLKAPDEEVEIAAKAAFAHDFIAELPLGYNTPLGEFGAGLSGGQKQRIAIARAIMKNAPIMLLDEATSALDSGSEQAVQLALDKLMVGRTAIVIAHRLSTVIRADMIFVLEEGKIVEAGNHQELIAKNGIYAKMSQIQFQP